MSIQRGNTLHFFHIQPFFDPFEIKKMRGCSWKGPKPSQVSIKQSSRKMSSPIRGSTHMCIQGHTHEPDVQVIFGSAHKIMVQCSPFIMLYLGCMLLVICVTKGHFYKGFTGK